MSLIPYVLRSPLWSYKTGSFGLLTVILASRIISFLNEVNTLQRKEKHEKNFSWLARKIYYFLYWEEIGKLQAISQDRPRNVTLLGSTHFIPYKCHWKISYWVQSGYFIIVFCWRKIDRTFISVNTIKLLSPCLMLSWGTEMKVQCLESTSYQEKGKKGR